MRILQINATYGFGSTGRNVWETHEFLTAHGAESFVAYGERKTAVDDHVFYIGSLADHKLHALLSRVTGLQGYFSRLATKKLCRRMDKIRPDLVHLHNLHSNYICLPVLFRYLEKKKIPVVVTLHDCWLFTGKCCHYIYADCNAWQTGCGNCPQLSSNNKSWFFDTAARVYCDKKRWFSAVKLGVIGVSDWITGEAKKSLLGHAAQINRIYNWIDTGLYAPCRKKEKSAIRARFALDREKPIILAVSQEWNENKGLCDLEAIAAALPGAIILTVGDLPAGYILRDNMKNIPYIGEPQTLAQLYSACTVLVNPSRAETFGKVTAECLACGTPAVVYDNTGSRELANGHVCLCAENRNPADMVKKIEELLSDLTVTADACRAYSVKHFEQGKNLMEYLTFYERMLK